MEQLVKRIRQINLDHAAQVRRINSTYKLMMLTVVVMVLLAVL